MIILKEQGTDQTFKFIPRTMNADTMDIKDEAENTTVTYAITFSVDRYYMSITDTVALKEGRQYVLTVKNGTDIVYKDMIFCTNQVIEDFTVNDNEYVQHSTDNEFIMLDD
jgi:hypothetical protein